MDQTSLTVIFVKSCRARVAFAWCRRRCLRTSLVRGIQPAPDAPRLDYRLGHRTGDATEQQFQGCGEIGRSRKATCTDAHLARVPRQCVPTQASTTQFARILRVAELRFYSNY